MINCIDHRKVSTTNLSHEIQPLRSFCLLGEVTTLYVTMSHSISYCGHWKSKFIVNLKHDIIEAVFQCEHFQFTFSFQGNSTFLSSRIKRPDKNCISRRNIAIDLRSANDVRQHLLLENFRCYLNALHISLFSSNCLEVI